MQTERSVLGKKGRKKDCLNWKCQGMKEMMSELTLWWGPRDPVTSELGCVTFGGFVPGLGFPNIMHRHALHAVHPGTRSGGLWPLQLVKWIGGSDCIWQQSSEEVIIAAVSERRKMQEIKVFLGCHKKNAHCRNRVVRTHPTYPHPTNTPKNNKRKQQQAVEGVRGMLSL